MIHMRWTSLVAFMLILLFAGAADGLMDVLGPIMFLAVGGLLMGLALVLVLASKGWRDQSVD